MVIVALVRGAATLSWFAVIAIMFAIVARAAKKQPTKGIVSFGIGLFVFAIIASIMSASIVFLEPDERGVVVSPYEALGYRDEILDAGLGWIIPGENVKYYSIARSTYTMSAGASEGQLSGDDSIRARTKDGQEVFIDASIIYQINPVNVTQLHIEWRDRYREELVRPTTRGIVRDVASQYGIEEIVSSQRASLEAVITESMATKFAENNLVLIDFVLRDIHFSAEYAVAVEQKQIAEQQAQQAKFVVESKKQEAEQARQVAQGQADAAVIAAQGQADARLIQAEAEASALGLINNAIKDNPDLLTYQYIEKLGPEIEVMLLPNNAPFLFPLPGIGASGTTSIPE